MSCLKVVLSSAGSYEWHLPVEIAIDIKIYA